jgi:predicted dinucleotide-binding enzyme
MKVGFIGAGVVANAFARHRLAQGHEVLLSNRSGAVALQGTLSELGPGAHATTREEAAADVVVLAVRWKDVPEAVKGLPAWDGKIIIDTTNQFIGPGQLGQVAAVFIAEQLPGARVVKALNTLYAWRLEDGPDVAGGKRVVCISGDDAEAKATVTSLIAPIGFQVLDLGSLASGGLLQQAGGQIAGKDLVVHDTRQSSAR